MNYIYFYKGNIPTYVNHSISSVQKYDKDSKIYFISDSIVNNSEIININISSLESVETAYIKKLNYFKELNNPLWETSLLRIFYLLNAAKKLNLNYFVHFDSDVLIYKSFDEISESFKKNKLNITPVNELFLIFGYSYVDGLEAYDNICFEIIKILENAKYYQNKYYENKVLNEMILLNIAYQNNPNNFNLLNTLPSKNKNIFDPISYGQYLSGIDKKLLSRKTVDEDHYVGREMLKKGFDVKFLDSKPQIMIEKEKFELVNLHVHKKNLEVFL